MKKIKNLFAIAILLIADIQITNAASLITINQSNKAFDTEDRQVSGFSGISSSGSFNIIVTMGNTETLKLEGDKETISEIETKVESGILKISRNKEYTNNWNSSKGKVTIYITAKSLNSLTQSGSGDMKVDGTVKADRLATTLRGSGSISLTADAKNYSGTISGSGEINVKGNTDHAKVTIAGSGEFEGKNLRSDDADIQISGSGDASITAEKTLDAVVSGSGNIRYSGNAQVTKTKNGSGSVSKL